MSDDVHRQEALATFGRSVAYIQNVLESRDDCYLDVEVVADFAIIATLGPPRAEGEASPFDQEEMTEEQIEAVLPDQIPTAFRDMKVTITSAEILRTVEQFRIEHPDETGFSDDPDIRACQVAVQLNYQKYGDGYPTQQESWDLVANYLGNHDDGFWMLTEPALDDEEDD